MISPRVQPILAAQQPVQPLTNGRGFQSPDYTCPREVLRVMSGLTWPDASAILEGKRHWLRLLIMVNTCCVVGCHSHGGWDEGISFYLIPSIITKQGLKTQELSSKRRNAWLSSINWNPSKHSRVCSKHFITGKLQCLTTKQQDTFRMGAWPPRRLRDQEI